MCGISGERVKLLNVVSSKGIVKLCKKCASESGSPIIKSFGAKFGSEDVWKEPTVREVLSRVSGIEIREKPKQEDLQLKKQEEELKRMANLNIQKAIQEKQVSTEDLVDKFHWILMRIRRAKKITQAELAKEIGESEAAVKMAEQGSISAKTPLLIDKIESYFGIKLRKKYEPEIKEYISPGNLGQEEENSLRQRPSLSFDPVTTKDITIADLRHMRKEKEMSLFQKPEQESVKPEKESIEPEQESVEPEQETEETKKEQIEEMEKWEEEDKKMERNLSDSEIDDLIFGRK